MWQGVTIFNCNFIPDIIPYVPDIHLYTRTQNYYSPLGFI